MFRKINLRGFHRNFSSSPGQKSLVEVTVDEKTGYSTVALNNPPVNSLNLEVFTALSKTLDELTKDRSRGVILTSTAKGIFSGGLDVMELYKPTPERAREFWTSAQDFWMKLYGSPYPVAAAINGHAVAGGCLIAMSCEYRVMCKKFTIGLNETRIGLVAPSWFIDPMLDILGYRQTELALTLGTLFTTDDAKRIGLIDEVVESKYEAIELCTKWLNQFKNVSPQARALTKKALRAKPIADLKNNRENDIQNFVSIVGNPKVEKSIEAALEALKKRK